MDDINEPLRPPEPTPAPEAEVVGVSPFISVDDDVIELNDETADEVTWSKFDNADEESADPPAVKPVSPPPIPAEPAAQGVGGDITPPSAEIRSSEPAKLKKTGVIEVEFCIGNIFSVIGNWLRLEEEMSCFNNIKVKCTF